MAVGECGLGTVHTTHRILLMSVYGPEFVYHSFFTFLIGNQKMKSDWLFCHLFFNLTPPPSHKDASFLFFLRINVSLGSKMQNGKMGNRTKSDFNILLVWGYELKMAVHETFGVMYCTRT